MIQPSPQFRHGSLAPSWQRRMEWIMRIWRMTGEPSLKELLSDEIMDPVMRSAGVNGEELRRRLADLARRLEPAAGAQRGSSCCGAGI